MANTPAVERTFPLLLTAPGVVTNSPELGRWLPHPHQNAPRHSQQHPQVTATFIVLHSSGDDTDGWTSTKNRDGTPLSN